ncbi:MAG: hypothetical protein HRU09_17615 [Oligoflexales bacterium]|nr:hypothetical protein [Oligoflexales bacterium]
MDTVDSPLVQEIFFQKQDLSGLNSRLNGTLNNLSVKCTVQPETLDKDLLKQFLDRLKGEVRFVLDHITLYDLESLCLLLKKLLLSDGRRLNMGTRADILQVDGVLSYQQDKQASKMITFSEYSTNVVLSVEQNSFGKVDVVYENQFCGLYRLRIAPFAHIPSHLHKTMQESELIASDGLILQKETVKSGTCIQWPHNFPHCYVNEGKFEQLVLCIDKPAFNPEDEVQLAGDAHLPKLKDSMIKNYW